MGFIGADKGRAAGAKVSVNGASSKSIAAGGSGTEMATDKSHTGKKKKK